MLPEESKITSIFKIVLLGDEKVGKTSIRLKYLGEALKAKYTPTLGSDFSIKKVGTSQLQIWDLAGQESFKPIIQNYYIGSNGIILVFDTSRKETMKNIQSWIDGFVSSGNSIVPMVVIGNKIDLRSHSNIAADTENIEKYVQGLTQWYGKPITYVETSALTGENIDNAFSKLIDHMKA